MLLKLEWQMRVTVLVEPSLGFFYLKFRITRPSKDFFRTADFLQSSPGRNRWQIKFIQFDGTLVL